MRFTLWCGVAGSGTAGRLAWPLATLYVDVVADVGTQLQQRRTTG